MGTFGLIAAAGACVAGIVWGTRELIILDAQEKEEAVKTANRKKLHGMMSGGDTVVHYTTPPDAFPCLQDPPAGEEEHPDMGEVTWTRGISTP